MAAEQCRHRRNVGVLSSTQCRRPATRDGYCSRHHPSYVSPREVRDLAALALREGQEEEAVLRFLRDRRSVNSIQLRDSGLSSSAAHRLVLDGKATLEHASWNITRAGREALDKS